MDDRTCAVSPAFSIALTVSRNLQENGVNPRRVVLAVHIRESVRAFRLFRAIVVA